MFAETPRYRFRRGTTPAANRHRFLRRLGRRRGAQIGAGILVVLVLAFLIGPLLWDASPTALHPGQALRGLSAAHPLGTDVQGRDQLARLLIGGRRSLLTVLTVLGVAFVAGVTVGITAAMSRPAVDVVLTRANDVLLAFPPLVAALVVLAVLGPGFGPLIVAVAVSFIGEFVRLSRSYTLTARHRPVVVAARMAGLSWWRVIGGHVLPETASKLVVLAALDAGHVLVTVAGLSFLGFGAQPPTPEWGLMLSDAQGFLAPAPWLLIAPGAALVLLVISFNFVGIALDDTVRGKGYT